MQKCIRLMAIIIVCLSFADQNVAQAKSFEILNPQVSQGNVVMVRIYPQFQTQAQGVSVCINILWNGTSASIQNKDYFPNKHGEVVIGVDVNTKPDKYIVWLVECGDGARLDWYYDEIEVLKKDFGTPWYAGPVKTSGKAVQERRAKDIVLMRTAYDSANKYEDYTSGHFVPPLNSIEETDSFGTPRLYGSYNRKNKTIRVEKEVPHNGVDLRAKTPLPVMAINSGKVLLAHYFPLRGTEGNLLVIDHGSSILSLYLHLSKFKVKAGDIVKNGQVVALTGATPRGTPPHLHFMVKIHGTNIDPLVFIETANKYQDSR